MKSLVIAGFVLAVGMAMPATAAAQDPDPVPVPVPAPQAPQPPPPPARVAVPRAPEVRNPEAGEARAPEQRPPSADQGSGASRRANDDQQRGAARRANDDDRGRANGTEERIVRRPAPATASAADANDDADAAAQRRGAVRRPPSNPTTRGTADRAVPRTARPQTPRGGNVYVYSNPWNYSRYYNPWGYGSFGLGYFYYSPWSWYPSAGYGYGYGGGYGYPGYPQHGGPYGFDIGSVRLKVKPRDAEVWVDGYYAGVVDDFDGMFQALKLDRGPYKIEIRKSGFETLQFDVRVQPERTITFRGDMQPRP
jgi:hypothetical protein